MAEIGIAAVIAGAPLVGCDLESDRGGNGLGPESERIAELRALCDRGGEIAQITVFLEKSSAPDEIKDLQGELAEIDGVEDVVFMSREFTRHQLNKSRPDVLHIATDSAEQSEVAMELEDRSEQEGSIIFRVTGAEGGDLFGCDALRSQ